MKIAPFLCFQCLGVLLKHACTFLNIFTLDSFIMCWGLGVRTLYSVHCTLYNVHTTVPGERLFFGPARLTFHPFQVPENPSIHILPRFFASILAPSALHSSHFFIFNTLPTLSFRMPVTSSTSAWAAAKGVNSGIFKINLKFSVAHLLKASSFAAIFRCVLSLKLMRHKFTRASPKTSKQNISYQTFLYRCLQSNQNQISFKQICYLLTLPGTAMLNYRLLGAAQELVRPFLAAFCHWRHFTTTLRYQSEVFKTNCVHRQLKRHTWYLSFFYTNKFFGSKNLHWKTRKLRKMNLTTK